MLYNCNYLDSINLINFKTPKVVDISYMFSYCNSLTSINISNFNVSTEVNVYHMFYYCSSLKTINISSFIFKNEVYMFYNLPNYCNISINKNFYNSFYLQYYKNSRINETKKF